MPAWLEQVPVRAASQSLGRGMKAQTGDKHRRVNSPTLSLILRGQKLDYRGGWRRQSLVCLPRAKPELQYHAGREWTWGDNEQCASGGPLCWEAAQGSTALHGGRARWTENRRLPAWVGFQLSLGACPVRKAGPKPLDLQYQALPSLPTLPRRRSVDPIW